jgi:uncharacterized membrane protein SpoIIM required for sporulation
LNEERFVRDRIERWDELRALVDRAGQVGLRALAGEDVRRLGALYRAATADLATARTLKLSSETQAHLNRLCAAAHDLVYARRSRGSMERARRFLAGGFARLVRQTGGYHLAAAGAFAAGMTAAFLVFRNDPALADQMLGSHVRAGALRAAVNERYIDIPGLVRPLFSWGIMANNVNATLIGFALGSLAGVGGLLFSMWQGMFAIGGALAVYADEGVAHLILTFAAAHGPIELTAIFIGIGAGMRTGIAPLLPGRRSRLAALVETARESAALLGGAACMLVIAGLIEGFISPSALPPAVKWSVGALTVVGLVAYFGLAGRRSESVSPAAANGPGPM